MFKTKEEFREIEWDDITLFWAIMERKKDGYQPTQDDFNRCRKAGYFHHWIDEKNALVENKETGKLEEAWYGAIRYLKYRNTQELLDALLFSYGAIRDAISLKDGLDKTTGETVIKMITEQLDKHGVSYK